MVTKAKINAVPVQSETVDFYSLWDLEEITPLDARLNSCLYTVDGVAGDSILWDNFMSSYKSGLDCEIVIYDGECLRKVVFKNDDENMKMTVLTKRVDDGVLAEEKRTISPAVIYSFLSDDMVEYYVSDIMLVRQESFEDEKPVGEKVNFAYNSYVVSSDANITFPYQKTFTKLDDYLRYEKKYDDELNLGVLGEDLKTFDNDGGFNAHVVFLYGDMAGSEDITYELLDAIRVDGNLYIYMKKTVPEKKNSCVVKRQFVVTVPSEYLDEVNPDCINWIVYEDIQTK